MIFTSISQWNYSLYIGDDYFNSHGSLFDVGLIICKQYPTVQLHLDKPESDPMFLMAFSEIYFLSNHNYLKGVKCQGECNRYFGCGGLKEFKRNGFTKVYACGQADRHFCKYAFCEVCYRNEVEPKLPKARTSRKRKQKEFL